MLKRITLLGCLALSAISASAQNNIGYHSDNYAGIHNVSFQPADIVDSRYIFDLNLVGVQGAVGNNYIGLKTDPLKDFNLFNDTSFQDLFLVERLNGKSKSAYADLNVQGPSFMFGFGKNALAFQVNAHSYLHIEGINESVAYLSYRELDFPQKWNTRFQNKNFSAQAMAWMDYGLTYGREIFQIKNHYLKAAGTFKLLQGLASAQVYSRNLDISFTNTDTVNVYDSDITYGHSDNFEADADGLGYKWSKIGFGFDLGAVYELRRPADTYTYEMDNRSDNIRRDKNKYILKAGLSLCNIGSVPFTRGGGSRSFYANVEGIDLNDFDLERVEQFDSLFAGKFVVKNDSGTVYRQSLPFTINATLDYNIWKVFYVNATASIAPRRTFNPEKTRAITTFSITPRLEHKWIGLWVPFSYDAFNNWHIGAGLRLGPIVLGINDFTPYVMKKNVFDAGGYAMLRIPIPYGHKHDRDGDKVSNRKDKCRKDPGTWDNKGCPILDRDGDKVLDKDDACPDVKGLASLKGCPDRDGDTVTDVKDECPDVAGKVELAGCPDTDGDGISDVTDQCPEVPGTKEGNGCPDTDGDGVYDNNDKCITKAGPASNQGCPVENPDTDGDGVLNTDDNCPTVKGLAALKGCPDKDTDGDGVFDLGDECVAVPGLVELKGCPRKDEPVAIENLVFQTGSDIILPVSFKSLGELADIMKKNAAVQLLIEGHTDNIGTDDSNLLLSVKRADAVKKHLIEKGVNAAQITTKGYGETRPVADNKTAAGRAQNRRVEVSLK